MIIDPGARRTDGESVRIARDVLCARAITKVCLPEGPDDVARALARRGSRRPVVVGDDRALLHVVTLLHRERTLATTPIAMVPVGPPPAIRLASALGIPTDAVTAARTVIDGADHRFDLLVDDSDGVVIGELSVPYGGTATGTETGTATGTDSTATGFTVPGPTGTRAIGMGVIGRGAAGAGTVGAGTAGAAAVGTEAAGTGPVGTDTAGSADVTSSADVTGPAPSDPAGGGYDGQAEGRHGGQTRERTRSDGPGAASARDAASGPVLAPGASAPGALASGAYNGGDILHGEDGARDDSVPRQRPGSSPVPDRPQPWWSPAARTARSALALLTTPVSGRTGVSGGPAGRRAKQPSVRLRVEADGVLLADLDHPVERVTVATSPLAYDAPTARPPDPANPSSGLAEVVVYGHASGSPVRLRARAVTVSGPDFHYRADAVTAGPVRTRTWRLLPAAWSVTLPR